MISVNCTERMTTCHFRYDQAKGDNTQLWSACNKSCCCWFFSCCVRLEFLQAVALFAVSFYSLQHLEVEQAEVWSLEHFLSRVVQDAAALLLNTLPRLPPSVLWLLKHAKPRLRLHLHSCQSIHSIACSLSLHTHAQQHQSKCASPATVRLMYTCTTAVPVSPSVCQSGRLHLATFA